MSQQANRAARAALVLAAVVAVVAVALPAAAGSVDAGAAFATLKSLEGHWTGTAAGHPGGDVVYEVVSGGNTVMERMFPGSDNEMISMYYMEGDDLVMVHYCESGNQPKMKLISSRGRRADLRLHRRHQPRPGEGLAHPRRPHPAGRGRVAAGGVDRLGRR